MIPVHYGARLSGKEIIKRRFWMREVGQAGESCHTLRDEPSVHGQDVSAKEWRFVAQASR